ncbi:DNA-binding protein [Prevotella sp. AM34-19LB]|jgi:predicted histone-like DNA-binding protein|nr:DNA-binding protein [Prevotella sp. AM34-19LB]
MSMAKFRKVKNNRKNSPTRGMIYGRAVVNKVVHTRAIAKKITERCTVTEPDILAVINALMTEISANIADGNKVVLDDFGSFKLGIRTTPAESARKFTEANIKNKYIIYSPYSVMDQGKRVKPMLSGIKMEELTEYNGIEDKENGGGTSGGTSGDTSGGTDKDNPSGGNPPSGDTGKDNTGGGESGGDDNVNL